MKKIIVMSTLCALLTACATDVSENKETSENEIQETVAEETVETQEEENDLPPTEGQEIDVEKLVKEGMLEELKKDHRAGLLNNYPEAEIGIKYFPFKPSILVLSDFYLVEVTYKTGDYIEHEDFGVLYSSLEDGSYDSNQYSLILGDDRACDMCDIMEIDKEPGPTDPFTKFEYRSNGETFEATLSCDLAEMSFYWTRF